MIFVICVIFGLFMVLCLIGAAASEHYYWKLQRTPVSVATIVGIEIIKAEDGEAYRHQIQPADEPEGVLKLLTTQHPLGEVGDLIPVTYDAASQTYHNPRELWHIHIGTVLLLLAGVMMGCFMYELGSH